MKISRRAFVAAAPSITATLTLHEVGKPPIEHLDVSILRLQPGDVIVLRAPGKISDDTAQRLRRYLEQELQPKGVKAWIFGDGLIVDHVLRG